MEPRFFELELVKLSDVLAVYAEEEAKWEALISKAEKDCAKCNLGIEERKQKLRELWKHSVVLKGGRFLAIPKKKFEELLKE